MNSKFSESEIDDIVIAQAEDNKFWEDAITVKRKNTLSLPPQIKIDKDILGGTPIFNGTRVPVSALLDNLAVGISLDEFLKNFPTVKREQAVQILEYFKSSLSKFKEMA
ncbi:MAG: DUF433 domain-containing protein [Pyrinomonadaceae bacterium]